MWHPEMWFTILSPLFYQFISPPSTSFGVCLRLGHPRIPQQCTFPFASPSLQSLFHICISLFPFLWCIFLYLLWLFLILFDPCVKSVLGQASRSPSVMTVGSLPSGDDPWTPRLWPYSFTLFQLQPYLYTQPRFFSSLNISSSKGQPQSGHGRDWSELGICVKQKKKK